MVSSLLFLTSTFFKSDSYQSLIYVNTAGLLIQ